MLAEALLFAPERLAQLTVAGDVIVASDEAWIREQNRRFEGIYGQIYDRVIQTPALRTAVFSLWGSADPLLHLKKFVSDAVAGSDASTTLVDLASGGGMLLPLLAREGFEGTVVEVDLAGAMLRRATALHRGQTPSLRTVFLQANALDLPLRDAVADLVVSINGLHVVSDHARFLVEAARITRRGGRLSLITPVTGPSLRSEAILRLARALGITPAAPPTLSELHGLLVRAGFAERRSYGGESIAGMTWEKIQRP